MNSEQESTQSQAEPSAVKKWMIIVRGVAPGLIINAACPLIIYALLTNYLHISTFIALLATGIPSVIDSIVGIIRNKRIDFLAGIALLSIVISLGLILLGGSPKLLLVRESFFTFTFGLAFLLSLFLPKPLAFYTARQFLAGRDEARIAWYQRLWTHDAFRTIIRIQTIIWGVCLILEAVVRTYLVFVLSIEQFLVVSPFILYGIIGLTIVFSGLFMRYWREKHNSDELQQEMSTAWASATLASE